MDSEVAEDSSVKTIEESETDSEAELSAVVVVVVVALGSSHAAKAPSAMHALNTSAQILDLFIKNSPQIKIYLSPGITPKRTDYTTYGEIRKNHG